MVAALVVQMPPASRVHEPGQSWRELACTEGSTEFTRHEGDSAINIYLVHLSNFLFRAMNE